VRFQSPVSVFAVCGFCRSQVVRDGATLSRIGESAEVFDDHGALKLGATGRFKGLAFTLVGRRQLRSAGGVWSEWHALFDSALGDAASAEADTVAPRSGWLSEDNGRYVFAFESELREPPPASTDLRVGDGLSVDGRLWSVASVVVATLVASEGELPGVPRRSGGFVVADLRSTTGDVATLEYADPQAPSWSVGQAVAISELSMQGLAEGPSEGTVAGRSLACPNCGNAITLALSDTRSVVCGQCEAVVDVSQGLGSELQFHTQTTGTVSPLIPLGTVGRLAVPDHRQSQAKTSVQPWQAVGYAERCTLREPGSDDEQTFWRETLLYHRTEGFAFLVDSEDGWSLVRPITGVPLRAGSNVKLGGVLYRQAWTYTSRVTHVLGEFYWPVVKDQRTRHTDFVGTGAHPNWRLNREQTGSGRDEEVTWSVGETVDAEQVRRAFGLPEDQRAALARDVKITSAKSVAWPTIVFWIVVLLVIMMVSMCSSDDRCDDERDAFGAQSAEYRQCLQRGGGPARTGGGSYGGWSGGGGHK
jgi:ribosomal protein S27AE